MKTLITNDTETIIVEIITVNPDDEDVMFPMFHRSNCRACGWDSYASDGSIWTIEGDAITDADSHLDYAHPEG